MKSGERVLKALKAEGLCICTEEEFGIGLFWVPSPDAATEIIERESGVTELVAALQLAFDIMDGADFGDEPPGENERIAWDAAKAALEKYGGEKMICKLCGLSEEEAAYGMRTPMSCSSGNHHFVKESGEARIARHLHEEAKEKLWARAAKGAVGFDPMKYFDEGMKEEYPELMWPIAQVRQALKHNEGYGRIGDMSPDDSLRLVLQEDGDVCVGMFAGGLASGIEFCSVGSGGGKSPRTREALLRLMLAMKLDNEDANYSQQYKRNRK